MSIRFQIASALVKASGMKKLFALPQEELLKKVRKLNRKRDFRLPAGSSSATRKGRFWSSIPA